MLKDNLETLFENIIFNGKLNYVDSKKGDMIFQMGTNSFATISMMKKHPKDTTTDNPLDVETLRWHEFCSVWNVSCPENPNLPIYTYVMDLGFRSYKIYFESLSKQETIYNYINKLLKEYEEKQLQIFMADSLK